MTCNDTPPTLTGGARTTRETRPAWLLVLLVGAGCYNLSGRTFSDGGDVGALDARDGSTDLPVVDTPAPKDAADVEDVADAPEVADAPVVADTLDVTDVLDVVDVLDAQEGGADVCALTLCSGACVDTQSDVHHCGACARDCAALPNVTGAAVRCAAGVCVIPDGACDVGHGDCDRDVTNGCEADLSRADTCGACTTRCAESTPLCRVSAGAATCVSGCDASQTRCGMSCVNTANDPLNCGACGNACATLAGGVAVCASGRCGVVCDPGNHLCGSACVDNTTVSSCGSRCDPCPTPAHSSATCTADSCGFVCDVGFGDCDRDASNGCETDTRTSGAHCGACNRACMAPTGSVAACVGGSCTVMSLCPAGQTRCGDTCQTVGGSCSAGIGACTRTGVTSCVGGSVACGAVAGTPTTETCDGIDDDCDGLTDEGFCRVDGACYTDGQINPANNCQTCLAPLTTSGSTTWSNVAAGTTCRAAAGICDIAERCDGSGAACPVDAFASSSTMCRAAAGVCDMAERCTGVTAACPADAFVAAGTVCRTPTSIAACDPPESCPGTAATCPANVIIRAPASEVCDGTDNNCNGVVDEMPAATSCPARANTTSTCASGVCGFTCNAGFADCNSTAADGCEVDTSTGVSNCGACGRVCSVPANASATCAGGACGFVCNPGYALAGSVCVAACGVSLGSTVSATIVTAPDGAVSSVGTATYLHNATWLRGNSAPSFFGGQMWFIEGTTACGGWGARMTAFVPRADGTPGSVVSACEPTTSRAAEAPMLAAGPALGVCYITDSGAGSPPFDDWCGLEGATPGSFRDVTHLGSPGGTTLGASSTGFAAAYRAFSSGVITLYELDAGMRTLHTTPLVSGSWYAQSIARVGAQWWVMRIAGAAPYTTVIDRVDDSGTLVGSITLPTIGTASPSYAAAPTSTGLAFLDVVGGDVYYGIARPDGTVGARRVMSGGATSAAGLVSYAGGLAAVINASPVQVLRLDCEGRVVEGPIAVAGLGNPLGAAVDATGLGLWILGARTVATESFDVYVARVGLHYSIALQPGPADGKDIWTTSVYSYAPGGGPGGGLDNEDLRVGGWADEYRSLLQFDLSGLPTSPVSATLELYDFAVSDGSTTTTMWLDRISAFWDWRTMGTGSDRLRLWWADRPPYATWSASPLPAPVRGAWYRTDITDLVTAWLNGTHPNYGIQLRPTSTSHTFNGFYSSNYLTDPTLRPRLVVRY